MTVEDLVLNGRFSHLSYPRIYTDTDKKIAREAMQRMSIDALAGTPLSALSGGMRQSAYIAMILAQDSDYVLLDEPLTYLDISHQLSLMRSLKTLVKEGRGIITVMHDLPLAASFSDEIVLMNNGSVIESLPPSELVSLPVIEELFSAKLVCNGGIFSYQY
jgi:iron complex transport system ATP-binding protein